MALCRILISGVSSKEQESFLSNLYSSTLDIFWFGGFLWLMNHCRLFNVKSCLHKYIMNIYKICEHILQITFLKEPEPFFGIQLNGFTYCYATVRILHQSLVCTQFVLSELLIGPYQVLPGINGNESVALELKPQDEIV